MILAKRVEFCGHRIATARQWFFVRCFCHGSSFSFFEMRAGEAALRLFPSPEFVGQAVPADSRSFLIISAKSPNYRRQSPPSLKRARVARPSLAGRHTRAEAAGSLPRHGSYPTRV